MNSKTKDQETEAIAEQKTETESGRQNVTVARDQSGQSADAGEQVMAKASLVQKDDNITRKVTKGHYQPPFDDLRPQDRIEVFLSSPLQSRRGKYLLCQIFWNTNNEPDLEVYVTGPGGDLAIALRLQNYSFGGNSNLGAILPPGSFLVVRNPKLATVKKFMLVCDNPAEVELVSKKRVESKFPEFTDLECKWGGPTTSRFFKNGHFWSNIEEDEAAFAKLKKFGNLGFANNRFSVAIRFYDMALDYCGENLVNEAMIQSNKSAALLAIDCFHAALKCAEAALEIDPSNEKCNYRKTKALIGLKKYEEALSFLENKFVLFPSLGGSKELKNLLETIKFLSSRKSLGPTESQLVFLLMKNAEDHPPEDQDKFPEFTGPLTLVSQVQGKGRGIVATEDIRTGQLLICSKAFAFQISPSNTAASRILAKENAAEEIANKLLFDPELGPEFYNLTAGAKLGHLGPDNPKSRHVDMKRIKEILRINAFGSERCEGDKTNDEFTGLWILPSLFNHSCSEYNCVWILRGEWMTVWAISEIKKGEELTLFYKSPIINYHDRHNYFSSLGFSCVCKLCQLEAREPFFVRIEREKILNNLDKLTSDSGEEEIQKALKGVEKLVSLRKDNVSLNFPLLSPQIIQLTNILFHEKRAEECISVLSAMFDVANASVRWHDHGTHVATTILSCHVMRKDKEATKIWMATVNRLIMKLYESFDQIRAQESVSFEILLKQLDWDFFKDDE